MEDKTVARAREGALFAFECLCEKLGRLFEPYGARWEFDSNSVFTYVIQGLLVGAPFYTC